MRRQVDDEDHQIWLSAPVNNSLASYILSYDSYPFETPGILRRNGRECEFLGDRRGTIVALLFFVVRQKYLTKCRNREIMLSLEYEPCTATHVRPLG